MKMTPARVASLFAPACALGLGLCGIVSTAAAQSMPITVTDPLAGTSSPLMMSALAGEAAGNPASKEPSKAAADDGWRFRLAIPVWVPGLSGDMTVKGHKLSGGNSSSDTASSLGDTLDFAASLHIEAEKGRWGLFADTLYTAFSDDKTLRTGGTAEATVKSFLGELGGFYTFMAPEREQKGWGAFRADALAGVRLTSMELGAETKAFDVSVDKTLVDPFIGSRMELGLTDWLSYKLRGDIGGFGISSGTTSKFVWNIDTGFEFHLAKWCDLDLGYRWLDYDFERGSDSDAHLLLSGPYVTIQFRF